MEATRATKYKFDQIFSFDIITRTYTPLYTIQINGILLAKDIAIPEETKLGKLSPYDNLNRDVAGVWNQNTQILEIVGYF